MIVGLIVVGAFWMLAGSVGFWPRTRKVVRASGIPRWWHASLIVLGALFVVAGVVSSRPLGRVLQLLFLAHVIALLVLRRRVEDPMPRAVAPWRWKQNVAEAKAWRQRHDL